VASPAGLLSPLALDEARRVGEAAASELDAVLADLEAWVNLDTPSYDVAALDAFAGVLAETLERYGLRSELVEAGDGGRYLHAVLEGPGRARVALLCHHDTVFPLGTAARRPFAREGERVLGPGVADMKGGIAVAVHATRLMALGPRPFGRLEIVSAPDEEIREAGPPATLEHLRDFDAVLCMECAREDHSIVSARKAGYWFRVRALGRQEHAGVNPDGGRNAVVALCREALRLSELHRSREDLTLVVTEFRGGEGLNTVPGRAVLTGDLRARTADDLGWALEQIRDFGEHDGVKLRAEEVVYTPPMERTPAVEALAHTAIALGTKLGHDFGEATTGGASDGSYAADADIPTLDGLGPAGGLDHTEHEYAEVPTFAPRIGVVAGLVAAVEAGLLEHLTGSDVTTSTLDQHSRLPKG
jgi:glutamate carboxypeptidase